LACLLGLVQASLLLCVAWEKSDTADETRYLASAAALWAHDDPRDLCEAPALPKRAFGVALQLAERELPEVPPSWQAAREMLIQGQPASILRARFFAARCATIFAVVGAGFFVWLSAGRFGARAAAIAHALWCFSPTLLANGSLATLDPWAAASLAVVLWTSTRFVERPSLARSLAVGAACGVAAATKITTILVVPLVVLMIVGAVLRRDRHLRAVWRSAGLTIAVVAAALATLWTIYGFSVGGVDLADPCQFLVAGVPSLPGWFPAPAWIEGVAFQLRHGQAGHAGYLFGEVGHDGWWWFYLACLALKVPIGTQALTLFGAVWAIAGAYRHRPRWWIDVGLLAYPWLLAIAMSLGRHQAGISFLLPALPFFCVWLGRAADLLWGARRAGRWIVPAVLLLSITETLSVHPHYLMFFNVWAGGPEGGPRFLIHRDDWGQDKRLLAEWQQRHGIERIYYAPYGPNAEEWGVVFAPVPCEPTPGVYALHAVEVHRPQFGLTPGCIDWLTAEPPDERLGYSIYLYFVDSSRIERLRARSAAPVFWRSTTSRLSE
jgi:hypothetical protein